MFTFFLPAAGYRRHQVSGDLVNPSTGNYWSSTLISTRTGPVFRFDDSASNPASYHTASATAHAFNIRCVR